MKLKTKSYYLKQTLLHILLIAGSLLFVVPLFIVISSSFSSADAIEKFGYSIFPKEWVFDAYKEIFRNPTSLIDAYKVTTIISVITTVLGVFLMSMAAYPLSRKNFVLKKFSTLYIFLPMLFPGGLIPSYIINTQFLNLGNSYLIYILPSLINVWNIIVIRTFFQGLPGEMIESAKIDGASEFSILFKFIIPLSKPVIATISLLMLLSKWNDWNTTLIYIRDNKLYTLQYLLQRILKEAEFLKNTAQNAASLNLGNISVDQMKNVSTEAMRYAMCVIAAGPMLVIFPFFQKYFAKGLTIGSVKG